MFHRNGNVFSSPLRSFARYIDNSAILANRSSQYTKHVLFFFFFYESSLLSEWDTNEAMELTKP